MLKLFDCVDHWETDVQPAIDFKAGVSFVHRRVSELPEHPNRVVVSCPECNELFTPYPVASRLALTEDDCMCPCHESTRQCGNCSAGRHGSSRSAWQRTYICPGCRASVDDCQCATDRIESKLN